MLPCLGLHDGESHGRQRVVAIIGVVDWCRWVCEWGSVVLVPTRSVGAKGYSMLRVTKESKSQHTFDIQARLRKSI